VSGRVLFVDDEPAVLSVLERQLGDAFDIHTATSAEEAFRSVEERGPYAVVVADMAMPGTDGATLLARLREMRPEVTRVMLTGTTDLGTLVTAINRGGVFRFLTKPCASDALVAALSDAFEYHRLVTAERELLERTLRGAVEMLADTLALTNPAAFSRATRMRAQVSRLAKLWKLESPWELEVAALLSQVGCVTLLDATVEKLREARALTTWEARAVAEHPKVAERLLAKIPRLERVARMVGGQFDPLPQPQPPHDPAGWDVVLLGAQALRVVGQFEELLAQGVSRKATFARLRKTDPPLPEAIVAALEELDGAEPQTILRRVGVFQLTTSMILASDVTTTSDILLARKGQPLSDAMLARLRTFSLGTGVREPIEVLVPLEQRDPRGAQEPASTVVDGCSSSDE
jgi:CheY-like chemotaxis protein